MSNSDLVPYAGLVMKNKSVTLYADKDHWPIPTIWKTDYICEQFKNYKEGDYFIPGDKISNYTCQFLVITVRDNVKN